MEGKLKGGSAGAEKNHHFLRKSKLVDCEKRT